MPHTFLDEVDRVMYSPPATDLAYDYENNFYLTCKPGRLGKCIAHYEAYKRVVCLPGAVVECGIFKGASFSRFAMLRALLESNDARKIVGFDVFGKFPATQFEPDKRLLAEWTQSAGDESISDDALRDLLKHKQCDQNLELIKGDIVESVPSYAAAHPELRIALLNLDVDVYEPNVVVLEHFWDRMAKGGILLLDDYGIFPGATQAVDEFFKRTQVTIEKFPFAYSPSFIVKS